MLLFKSGFERLILFGLVIYRVSLDIAFLTFLDTEFYYSGFRLNFSFINYSLSWILLLYLFIFIPKQSDKISNTTLQLLFLMMYVPFSSFFGMTKNSLEWFLIFSLFWLIVVYLLNLKFSFKIIKPPKKSTQKNVFFTLLFFVIIVFVILFYKVDFKLNFDIYAVYDIRAEKLTESIPLAGYFVTWTAKVFLPFLLVYSILKIKPRLNFQTIFILVLFFIIFSITGHKSYLFAVPMLIGSILLLRTSNFYLTTLTVLSSLTILGVSFYMAFGSVDILTLLVRRTLFIPAQISFYYHDFFQDNHVYLSNGIMSPFFNYPFDAEPPFLIGEHYFSKPEMSANNGIISDGYMNFGIIGVIIYSIILVIILKLLDSLTLNKNKYILWPLIFLGVKSLIDGALLTSLWTHGFFLAIFLCFLYPLENKTIENTLSK